jgi:hypothetical protein
MTWRLRHADSSIVMDPVLVLAAIRLAALHVAHHAQGEGALVSGRSVRALIGAVKMALGTLSVAAEPSACANSGLV